MYKNECIFSPFPLKISIFFLVILFSSSSIFSVPLAILFKEPIIHCTDPTTQIFFKCSEQTACTGNYPYFLNKDEGPNSFTSDFQLICDGEYKKTLALTCIFIGFSLATIIQTFYIIDAKQRKFYIILGGFCLSGALFFILLVDLFELPFILIICLFLLSGFAIIYINTFAYMYVSEHFKGDFSSFTIVSYNIGWGIIGIIYSIIGYVFNADWRVMIAFAFVFSGVSCIIFALIKTEEKNMEEFNEFYDESVLGEEISIISYWKDMWTNFVIRRNFLIYTLTWSFYCMIYAMIYVEIGSVGGNIYFNTIFCCFLEIFTAFFGSLLTKKYNCEEILKVVIFIEAFMFIIFALVPVSSNETSGLQMFFLVLCLFIAKISNDLLNLMIYLSLPKMFTEKYVALYVIISRISARILMIFMPIINFFIRKSVHPFVFYGIVMFICRCLLIYTKEILSDNDEFMKDNNEFMKDNEFMNNDDLGTMQGIVIASARHSLFGSIPHEEIRKKIKEELKDLTKENIGNKTKSQVINIKVTSVFGKKEQSSQSLIQEYNVFETEGRVKKNVIR